MVYYIIMYWTKLNSIVRNSILLCSTVWVLACQSVNVRGRLSAFPAPGCLLAGLKVKWERRQIVLLGACLLVCECEGAALSFFCCWLPACQTFLPAACLLDCEWEKVLAGLLLLGACLLVWECEGAALDFCCWLLACWSVSERESVQTSSVDCLLSTLPDWALLCYII